jgi:hypothetical protein
MPEKAAANKTYVAVVVLSALVLPAISVLAEVLLKKNQPLSLDLAARWFIFWAVGVRLLMAGLRQIFNPAFTAKDIFHIDHPPSHEIVRELGFANLCFGLVGVLSLFLPSWRAVSAFASGLYYGLAGLNHAAKKPATANEAVALVSDLFISLALAFYLFEII